MYNTLLIEDRGYVSVIEINRANKLNALGDDVRSDLLGAFKDFNSDPTKRVAILTGNGKAFSSGADLTAAGKDSVIDIEDELANSFHPILKEIVNSKKIFISAVKGVVAGAGMSLALACDISFASRETNFIMGFQGIALAPDTGLALILSRLAGARSKPYLLYGGTFSAKEAEEMGLAQVVDDPFMDAIELAENLSNGPFRAYSASKQLMNSSLYHGLDSFLDEETKLQGELGTSHDFREGVSAFREKREPQFNGK